MSDDKQKYLPAIWSYEDDRFEDEPPLVTWAWFKVVLMTLLVPIVIVSFGWALSGQWWVGILLLAGIVLAAVFVLRRGRQGG